ncbi:MAG: hypothetical protein GQ564_10100 [Bacteroidales bacterium]|nr:hypothetical protein [Bacteroidales bacterium]
MKKITLTICVLAFIFVLACEKEENLNKQPSIPILQIPENGSITDNNSVTFEWKESTDPENDDIYYTLYVSNDSLNWKSYEAYNGITLDNLDNNSPKFYSFEPGLKYYWKVSAINDSYNNAIDQELDNTSDVFHFFTILSSVTNLRYSSGHKFANLYWNDPENLDHIEITFDPEVSGIAQPVIINAGIGTCELTSLENGTVYSFFVKAYGKLNHSSKTDTIKALPLDPTQVHDADFNIYNITKIGEQTWLRENLRTTKWQDGTQMLYNYKISSQSDIYGYYYNPNWTFGEGAKGKNPCPIEYHVPSDEEWQELERFLGMSEDEINRYSTSNLDFYRGEDLDIGNILKTTSGWNDYDGSDGNGIDFYMFNILPAGGFLGAYSADGERTYIYSSTLKYDMSYTSRVFSNSSSGIGRYAYDTAYGSIRCIKD